MANHKRKRPKNRRAGCLMCKPWKINGNKRNKSAGFRKILDNKADEEDTEEYQSNPYYPFLAPILFEEEGAEETWPKRRGEE